MSHPSPPSWRLLALRPTDLVRRFGSATATRGLGYSAQGRVRMLTLTGPQLAAEVHGSSRYAVTVDLASEELDSSCTCPLGSACKHVVAALRTAMTRAAAGQLPDEAEPRPPAAAERDGDTKHGSPAASDGPPQARSLLGRWRIVESEQWDPDELDLVEPAHVDIAADGSGSLRMIAIEADLHWVSKESRGPRKLAFEFDGTDEGDPCHGTGSLQLEDDGTARGRLVFDEGASAWFRGERLRPAAAPPPRAEEVAPPPGPPRPFREFLGEWLSDVPANVRKEADDLAYRLGYVGFLAPSGAQPTLAMHCLQVTPSLVALGPGRMAGQCTCPRGRTGKKCVHQVYVALRLLRHLEQNRPLPAEMRAFRERVSPPSAEERLAALLEVLAPLEPETERFAGGSFQWLVRPSGERLSVLLTVRTALKSGALGKAKEVSPRTWEDTLRKSPHPADGALLELLRQGARVVNGQDSWRHVSPGDVASRLDACEVLGALAGHPDVHWQEVGRPVTVRTGRAALRVEREGDEWTLVPAIEGVAGTPAVRTKQGLVGFDERTRTLVIAFTPPAVADVLNALGNGPRVPKELGATLAEKLAAFEAKVFVELPAELQGREVPPDGQLRVALAPAGPRMLVQLRTRPLPGAPAVVPGRGDPVLRASVAGERLRTTRRLDEERSAAEALATRLGWEAGGGLEAPVVLEGEAFYDLLEKLDEPAFAEVVVEWPADSERRTVSAKPAVTRRIQLTSAADWFGVGGEIRVDGETIALAQLLAAKREGRRFVEIRKHRFVRLAHLLDADTARLADLTYEERGRLMLSRAAVALAGETAFGEEFLAPPAWKELVHKARKARKLDVAPPAGLRASLREYQREGYAWLRRLSALGIGGVLADDMGLGKTVQAIAALVARAGEGPQLVLCPASVTFGWLRELERFAPDLRRHDLRTSDRARLLASAGPGDVVVASYGLLRFDVDALSPVAWTSVVLDEAQAIKNWNTETSKAVRALGGWKIALTGTPVENHLGELHALMQTVAPGVLGPWEAFSRAFATPIEKNGNEERAAALARLLKPLVLRRTKGEVLTELPARTEVRRDIVLSKPERTLYEAARLAALEGLGEDEEETGDRRFQVLAELTKLRQLACAPALVVPSAPRRSEKVRALLDDLVEIVEEGHSALVFSQFVRLLDLVGEELDARGLKHLVLIGETPSAERARRVEAFQRGEARVFLISLKAGGTGLNLTAADYVFILDPWWNPAVEDQAADRAHRIGQTRPVTIVRLVAKDTLEERVLALHERKRALVAGVLGDTDGAGRLSTREIVDLLRESAAPETSEAEEAASPRRPRER